MGWQDRPYSRDQSFKSNPLLWLFSGSVPLFTAFGVRVRMHASLLLLIVLALATSEMPGGMGIDNAMTMVIALFSIILLHEYGHCFAARSVGGDANEILMWPLGGLAFADAPPAPLAAVLHRRWRAAGQCRDLHHLLGARMDHFSPSCAAAQPAGAARLRHDGSAFNDDAGLGGGFEPGPAVF
jgi:hypothetical protein